MWRPRGAWNELYELTWEAIQISVCRPLVREMPGQTSASRRGLFLTFSVLFSLLTEAASVMCPRLRGYKYEAKPSSMVQGHWTCCLLKIVALEPMNASGQSTLSSVGQRSTDERRVAVPGLAQVGQEGWIQPSG